MEDLFEQYGLKPKKVHMIPVRDYRGVPQQKFWRVVEDGIIYNQLVALTGKLPKYVQELNNKAEEP